MQPRRAGTAFILVTVLLDTLGLGLIIPVAPRLVGSFVHGDLGAASHYFGWLVSLYALMQFFFAPIIGGLSDHFGRRPVILVSLLGAAASYMISGFAPALAWLFVGRIIAGATGASFSAAGAYVADVTPHEKRAQAFGQIGAAFGLGFILGPAVGGLLGDLGIRIPYFVAAALNFCNMLYGLLVLPESLPKEKRRPFSLARANPFGTMRALARFPIVMQLAPTVMLAFLAQWILQSVWALSLPARFGWSMAMVGLSLMASGFATAIVQGALVKPIVAKIGEKRALVIGLVASMLGQLTIGAAPHGWIIFAAMAIFAIGGLAGPSVQALTSRAVGASEQGELQGGLNSLNMLMAIVGPWIGTRLIERFATQDAQPYVPGAPFYASAIALALGLVLAIRAIAKFPITAAPAVAPARPQAP